MTTTDRQGKPLTPEEEAWRKAMATKPTSVVAPKGKALKVKPRRKKKEE